MKLFDTHAHLDDEQFRESLPDIVVRAAAAGVSEMVAVGTTALSSRQCVEIAAKFPSIFAAVGIQPNYTHQAEADDWGSIERLVRADQVVALGETGLDRHWDFAPFEVQQDFFERHLRLSQSSGLPFVVHMRDCGDDILQMLQAARRQGPLSGVMHSFTGDAELAAECLALGLYISFAGMVTYKKSDELRGVARTIPLERILLETDSPYLSPHPKRGQRPNEPALLIHTAACLAETRGESFEDFAAATRANAKRLFAVA